MKPEKTKIISSFMSSEETERVDDECLHYDSDEEETSTCLSCGLIGFKRSNQVFDCSLSNSEIGDEDSEEELFEITLQKETLDTIREDCESTVFSLDIHDWKDAVYVAVGHDGDGDSSMGALSWALKHAVTPSTTLYLLHVFPEIKLIPSPLGKFPRSHVNPEYVNYYLNEKKGKRKLLLQKFIDLCVDSKAKVETILIESDNVAEAIVDLVGKHDIRKLAIGTTRSNLRKSGSRRRNGIADKVLKNAQESCDVKIICEGKEVIDQVIGYNSSSSRSKDSTSSQDEDEPRRLVSLMRFMTYPLWLFRPRFLSPR